MPISRLFVLAVSLTAGGGAAYLTTSGEPEIQQMTVTEIVPAEQVEILVAATNLEKRRRLDPSDLEWRPWPRDALRDDYITRSEDPEATSTYSGNLVLSSILEGEPVRADKVTDSDLDYLSAMLTPGRRAVSVKVTAESTAGGFILPEDRVDVLHTTVLSGTGGVTRTVVTNVRVLAVDQQTAAPEGNAVASAKTATLELDPHQAEIVSAAEATGALSLSLRSSADNSEVQVVVNETDRVIQIFGRGQSRTAKTN